jgi:predicted ferric reductase
MRTDVPDSKPPRSFGEALPAGGLSGLSVSYRAPWFAGWAWGAVLCTAYPFLILTPLLVFAFLSAAFHRALAAEIGLACALVAFPILALQFVVAARWRWIEAPFGLDVLLHFHRIMAFVAICLLCLHPLLIASEEGWSLLTRWQARWPLWAGRLALLLLLTHVGVTVFRRTLRLGYETWRRVHNAVACLLLILAFWHSLTIGSTFQNRAALAVWAVLFVVAAVAWTYGRVARPWLLRRAAFRVVSVRREVPHVWTVTLQPPAGQPLAHAPGQFQFLRPLAGLVPKEEHPFSLASSPSAEGLISLTIKECGDFTAGISRLQPGELATVHGPFGRFSHVFHPDAADLVFIAAGVGITPLMSMLRYMRDHRDTRRVLLVYASRGVADLVFHGELETIQAGGFPVLRTVHVLSQPAADWQGLTGRVDMELLLSLCGSFGGKTFFLCCPPAMTSGLLRGLRRAGVGPERIHTDYFGL